MSSKEVVVKQDFCGPIVEMRARDGSGDWVMAVAYTQEVCRPEQQVECEDGQVKPITYIQRLVYYER